MDDVERLLEQAHEVLRSQACVAQSAEATQRSCGACERLGALHDLDSTQACLVGTAALDGSPCAKHRKRSLGLRRRWGQGPACCLMVSSNRRHASTFGAVACSDMVPSGRKPKGQPVGVDQ